MFKDFKVGPETHSIVWEYIGFTIISVELVLLAVIGFCCGRG